MIIMKIEKQQNQSFMGFSPYNLTLALEENVLLNKALFDITGSDVPWVIMANNKEERRERINRAVVSFALIFISPLLILPLVNRFAMRKVANLTPKLFSKEYNAIRLSNEHLLSAEKTKNGLEDLSKTTKIDFNQLINKVGGDYEKLRQKIINAKNTVLASDLLLLAGSFGSIGFFNDWQTKKKTGQIGYSAEMKMADKEIVEKRAEQHEKTSKIKLGIFIASIAAVATAIPLSVRHGLISKNSSKLTDFVKKYASKFDYTNAIFAKRLPLAIGLAVAHLGIILASRNKTEVKDNAIRSSTGFAIFFGGDLVMSSLLGRLSDKHLNTEIIKHKENKNFVSKILPPVKAIKELENIGDKKSAKIAAILFWINFISMSALSGFGTPYLINKIIKKDIQKDVEKSKSNKKIE